MTKHPFEITSHFEILKNGACFLNAKRVLLLKEIDRQGSLSAASKQLKMSYQQAWHFVSEMNELSPLPLVLRKRGGASGGGAELTRSGVKAIQEFERLNMAYTKFGEQMNEELNFCFF